MSNEKLEEILYRENIELAPIYKRALAFFIDWLVLTFAVYLIFIFMGYSEYTYQNITSSDIAITSFIFVAYPALFVFLYGATLGKLACRIRIISIDTLDSPTPFLSIIRSISLFIGSNLFFITFLFAFSDMFKRTLHDMIAKTIVVQID